MSMTLGDIAGRYGCELHGDPEVTVDNVATLSGADKGAITFLANQGYRDQLEATKASAVILGADDVAGCPVPALVSPNPYVVYARVAAELHPAIVMQPGVHEAASVAAGVDVPASTQVCAGAVIEAGAVLGERVYVGPGTVISRDSRLGDDVQLMANVTVCRGVTIGNRCILHSGCVIGADGFGIAREESGWIKVPQVGGVQLQDDVEIGANSTIDRGAIEDTVIGAGVKIDNLVQIAHNVVIGQHTAIAAMTGISGSTTIGANCILGGACGVAGHISICDNVMLAAGTGVANSIKKPGAYGGKAASATEIEVWRKNVVRYSQLDKMARRLRQLEKQVQQLTDDS